MSSALRGSLGCAAPPYSQVARAPLAYIGGGFLAYGGSIERDGTAQCYRRAMPPEQECQRCASSGRESCPLHGGQLDLLDALDWRDQLARARASLAKGEASRR